jgi:hypothetical protein
VRDAEPLPAFAQELVDLLAADAASAPDCASEPCGAA